MSIRLWIRDSEARRLIRADQIVEIGTVEVHVTRPPRRMARWRLEVGTRSTYGGVDIASERGDWAIEPRQYTLAYGYSEEFRAGAHLRFAEVIAAHLGSHAGGIIEIQDETESGPCRFEFVEFGGGVAR